MIEMNLINKTRQYTCILFVVTSMICMKAEALNEPTLS